MTKSEKIAILKAVGHCASSIMVIYDRCGGTAKRPPLKFAENVKTLLGSFIGTATYRGMRYYHLTPNGWSFIGISDPYNQPIA